MNSYEMNIVINDANVFDQLVECRVLSRSRAVSKLKELAASNHRLPLKLIKARIEAWQK
ncbi:MAG: hypothetical protein LKH27_09695 [Prevotella sp.]|nr:hypothetical protein [Prevotella sp.]MCI1474668.1 hypothetical protein [Prevotella sp.]MCI2088919.1 hypothetical protein [Prevotella sp.]